MASLPQYLERLPLVPRYWERNTWVTRRTAWRREFTFRTARYGGERLSLVEITLMRPYRGVSLFVTEQIPKHILHNLSAPTCRWTLADTYRDLRQRLQELKPRYDAHKNGEKE